MIRSKFLADSWFSFSTFSWCHRFKFLFDSWLSFSTSIWRHRSKVFFDSWLDPLQFSLVVLLATFSLTSGLASPILVSCSKATFSPTSCLASPILAGGSETTFSRTSTSGLAYPHSDGGFQVGVSPRAGLARGSEFFFPTAGLTLSSFVWWLWRNFLADIWLVFSSFSWSFRSIFLAYIWLGFSLHS